jgi:hypothetical protein
MTERNSKWQDTYPILNEMLSRPDGTTRAEMIAAACLPDDRQLDERLAYLKSRRNVRWFTFRVGDEVRYRAEMPKQEALLTSVIGDQAASNGDAAGKEPSTLEEILQHTRVSIAKLNGIDPERIKLSVTIG